MATANGITEVPRSEKSSESLVQSHRARRLDQIQKLHRGSANLPLCPHGHKPVTGSVTKTFMRTISAAWHGRPGWHGNVSHLQRQQTHPREKARSGAVPPPFTFHPFSAMAPLR
jgi:hypothetical protein